MTTLINKVAVNSRSCQWHLGNRRNLSVSKLEVKQTTLPHQQIPRAVIAKIRSSISTMFLFNSFPLLLMTLPLPMKATFWCEQCAVTTFVRLLKTRSATSIVKDWQLWAIRAWIAHCARPLKAVAPFITGAIDLGLKLMRMLEIIMMLLEINFISWIDWFKKAIKNFWSTLLVAAHTDGVIGACQSSLAVRFAKGLYVRYDL